MGAGSGWHHVASPVTSPQHSWGLLVGLSPRGAQPLSGDRGAQCQTRVGFGYRNTFGGFGCTKSAQAQPPSLPGPVGHPATVSPSWRGRRPPGMCQLAGWGRARVPAGIPGPGWHPGGRAAGLAIRHVGPGQASPAAAPRCASLAGTQGPAPAAKARRFPSPGEELGKDPVAQVRQRAHAPGDPPAGPSAKD